MATSDLLTSDKPMKIPKTGPSRNRKKLPLEAEEKSSHLRPGQGIREFLELYYGEEIPDGTSLLTLQKMMRDVEFTEDLVKLLAGIGISTNYALAIRGNRWTAQSLVDLLGTTDKSFSEKVKDLTLEEAKAFMDKLCHDAGIQPGIAKQLMAAAEGKK